MPAQTPRQHRAAFVVQPPVRAPEAGDVHASVEPDMSALASTLTVPTRTGPTPPVQRPARAPEEEDMHVDTQYGTSALANAHLVRAPTPGPHATSNALQPAASGGAHATNVHPDILYIVQQLYRNQYTVDLVSSTLPD